MSRCNNFTCPSFDCQHNHACGIGRIPNECNILHPELLGIPEGEKMKASDKQYGGNHYKDMKIQPMEFALANNLNYGQANAIKYITRYKNKNGLEDLKKAIHCLELLIEHEYTPKIPKSGPIINPHL